MDLRRLLPYSIPVVITMIFILSGGTNFVWVAMAMIFIISILRKSIGKFKGNAIHDEYLYFQYNVAPANLRTISGFFFVAFNLWVLYFLGTHNFQLWQMILFIYSCIIINSNFATSLAHELMHSERKIDRKLCTVILLQNGFFYLQNDHLFTHHRHVATVHDPATAFRGEHIYNYLLRSVTARFKISFFRNSHYPLNIARRLIMSNYLKLIICLSYLIAAWFIGINSFIYLILNYFFVTIIYESITYIQHYGLTRKVINSFKHENIELQHSWNCFYKTSAYMHYMMPVHSIHHVANDRDWKDDNYYGNEMPLPFATMMMTAWLPWKWFKLMGK